MTVHHSSEEEYIYNTPQPHDEEDAKRQEKSLLRQVLGQLKIGMDLTSVSAPLSIVMPKSFLEMIADHVAPTDNLLQVVEMNSAVDRILNVTKWISLSLSLSPQKGLSCMKPYNPILGEQFVCSFNDKYSTMFFSEQTCHHPPVSTFHLVNSHFRYNSVLRPKTTFYGNSVESIIHGKSVLILDKFDNEEYEIVLPSVVVRGIIWGQSCVEHGRSLIVKCKKSSLQVKLDVKNGVDVDGYLTNVDSGDKLAHIWGKVTEKLYHRTLGDDSASTEDTMTFVDMKKTHRYSKVVRPVCEQRENESRRVWHDVTLALYHRQYDTASQKKNEIEERERQKAKLRSEEWKPKLFTAVSDLQIEDGIHWFEISEEKKIQHAI